MSKYVCSCRALYADCKDRFDKECRTHGHTLFEVSDEIYAFIYDLKEENFVLKNRINKRNKRIANYKDKISKLEIELRVLRA